MNITNLVNLVQAGGNVSEAIREDYEKFLSVRGSVNDRAVPILLHNTHVVTFQNGVEKSISLMDFKAILDETTKNTSENIPPINLPFGCFMFSRSGDTMHLNCYYPEVIAKITYDVREDATKKIEHYSIPLPNIIISFQLKKVSDGVWGVQLVKYFSTPKTVTQLPDKNIINGADPENGIFKMPLSNVYEENTLCYGNNTMPSRFTDNLRGLDYYYQILTISPFNSDLGIRGITANYAPRAWYKHLSTLKKFPYELLNSSIRR